MLIVLPTMAIAMGDGIMDMGIHMAANSVEMEDAVVSATWTEIRKDVAKMDMDINGIAERIQDASELSYSYYKSLVDRIIAEKASEKEVEHLLDYMLDVCHDDRMLNLFKKVCRRYYSLYPEMIASEILAYKEWYED